MTTTTTTTTPAAYSTAAFDAACAALFRPANAVAAAMERAEAPKQGWAVLAAIGIGAKELTMDAVAASLVKAAQGLVSGRKAKGLNTISDVKALGKGFATVAGWYYDLKRADANGLLPLLLEGHSLTGLRRASAPTQGKGKGKAPAPKGKTEAPAPVAANVVAPSSLTELRVAIETARDTMTVAAMQKQQAEIARIVAAASDMARKVETAIRAAADAKAAKASAKGRQRKAAAPKAAPKPTEADRILAVAKGKAARVRVAVAA